MKITITLGDKTYEGNVESVDMNVNNNNAKNNGNDMNVNNNLGGGGKKKGKKASKGTRKLSPYMKFAQEARKNIIAKNPELKSDIIAVGKRIGEQWRALSDAEKAKY